MERGKLRMMDAERKPSLLGCALILLEDGCPPEPGMHLCSMLEDDDGGSCRACWRAYLYFVANGRREDPYRNDRLHQGGVIGA